VGILSVIDASRQKRSCASVDLTFFHFVRRDAAEETSLLYEFSTLSNLPTISLSCLTETSEIFSSFSLQPPYYFQIHIYSISHNQRSTTIFVRREIIIADYRNGSGFYVWEEITWKIKDSWVKNVKITQKIWCKVVNKNKSSSGISS
jgi:hypothetical protein